MGINTSHTEKKFEANRTSTFWVINENNFF
jgi:hypothetical protein